MSLPNSANLCRLSSFYLHLLISLAAACVTVGPLKMFATMQLSPYSIYFQGVKNLSICLQLPQLFLSWLFWVAFKIQTLKSNSKYRSGIPSKVRMSLTSESFTCSSCICCIAARVPVVSLWIYCLLCKR